MQSQSKRSQLALGYCSTSVGYPVAVGLGSVCGVLAMVMLRGALFSTFSLIIASIQVDALRNFMITAAATTQDLILDFSVMLVCFVVMVWIASRTYPKILY